MTLSKRLRHFGAATLLASTALAGAVSAAPMYTGIFDISNAFGHHGLWFGNLGLGGPQNWTVESGKATVSDTGGGYELNIVGEFSHKDNPTRGLSIDWTMAYMSSDASPACKGDGTAGIQSACEQGKVDGIAKVDKYNFGLSQTITGTGDLLGLELTATVMPSDGSKPPQLGICGNWLNCELGYSNWFHYTVTRNETNYSGIRDGNGDLNLDLAPVPVPAAGFLLLAGLGALGAMRRKAA